MLLSISSTLAALPLCSSLLRSCACSLCSGLVLGYIKEIVYEARVSCGMSEEHIQSYRCTAACFQHASAMHLKTFSFASRCQARFLTSLRVDTGRRTCSCETRLRMHFLLHSHHVASEAPASCSSSNTKLHCVSVAAQNHTVVCRQVKCIGEGLRGQAQRPCASRSKAS